jgi:hypothetical protein
VIACRVLIKAVGTSLIREMAFMGDGSGFLRIESKLILPPAILFTTIEYDKNDTVNHMMSPVVKYILLLMMLLAMFKLGYSVSTVRKNTLRIKLNSICLQDQEYT